MLREQFIAVLGHDLRNPVAAIAAGISGLEQRERLSAKRANILTEMSSSVARATELIDNVLDLARGRLGGGLILHRNADAPLTPILTQVIAEMGVIAPGRHLATLTFALIARYVQASARHQTEAELQEAANILSLAVDGKIKGAIGILAVLASSRPADFS